MKKLIVSLVTLLILGPWGCSFELYNPTDVDSISDISCPNNYIAVPGNATVGATADFCVMKYEAKNDGSGNAISQAETTPWDSISQADAKTECTDLNTLNGVQEKYDLISNAEWMAIARNIENVGTNWTGGSVGSGCLMRGNVGGTSACTGGNSGYDGPNPDFGTSRSDNGTAQLVLSNGQVIWDFSGNMWEWVDWTLGGSLSTSMMQADKPYVSGDAGPVDAWRELNAIDVFSSLAPTTSLLPTNPTYGDAQGVGSYWSGISGGAGTALRGGSWNQPTIAGIFFLWVGDPNPSPFNAVGFRCVYRP